MISKFHFFTEAILQKIQIKMGAVFLNVQLVVLWFQKSISLIHNTKKKKKKKIKVMVQWEGLKRNFGRLNIRTMKQIYVL